VERLRRNNGIYLYQPPRRCLGTAACPGGLSPAAGYDIDVATQEDYAFLAVEADASTNFDYTAVSALIRDRFEEANIAAELPENKWAIAQATTLAVKTGPTFTVGSEVEYLSVMISNYPNWAKLVYENGISASERDDQLEDFIMQLSGDQKNAFAAAVPTASYATDVATGLFSINGDAEMKGIKAQAAAMIKKKK
jgi:hypothetical protein